MFLGFCCKVLLRKKGVRVLCGIVLYVTIPLLKAGDIHERLLLLLLLLLHGGGTGRQSSQTANGVKAQEEGHSRATIGGGAVHVRGHTN